MKILDIVETLESLSAELNGEFANAVAEAVKLLVVQGERIVDLEAKLAAVSHKFLGEVE